MKFKRTQIAIMVGAVALICVGWLIGASKGDQESPLPEARAALNETPAKVSAADSSVAAAGALTSSSGEQQKQVSAPVVASLGSVAVTQDDMERLLRSLPETTRQQLKNNRPALEQWLRARLAEETLLTQALAQGWSDRPEIKTLTQAAERQVVLQTYLESVSQVPTAYPSAEELQAAYEANKAQLTIPAQYRVSQVFLAAPFQDVEAVTKARKQAMDVAKKARAEGADFAALVKAYSQDEATAERDGNIGWAPLQQLVPEIRASVSALEKGEVSDPVWSQAGFHVLKLVDYRAQIKPELSEVQGQLREALRRQRKGKVAQAYLQGLVESGTLSIDGATLSAAFNAVQ
ncbi:MAG: peptidylprolyl isomerase [Pusillimonas sp.]|nr:peptidylprolyl isomerase [Pusillimonas sp.]|tara:strand:- start:1717 stop:2760 length:1044 start_codon:yes stop_codon:yes gene_type:complete